MTLRSTRRLLPVILVILLAGCGGSAASNDPATATPAASAIPTKQPPPTPVITGGADAAVVNGTGIPMAEYRSLLTLAQRQSAGQAGITMKLLSREVLDQLIDDEVIREYAVAHHLDFTSAQLNARIAQDERSSGGHQGLLNKLKAAGVSFAFYKQLTIADLRRHSVAQHVTPLEYAHARHILIATASHKPPRTDAAAHALALQVLAKVKAGGNFAALARKYSDDTYSAKQGGDLGTFCPGQMVPPFDHASFTAPLNTPTLVHSQYGYHILEVLGRGVATAKQCPQSTPESSSAFLTWVSSHVARAHVRRLAHVA